MLAQRGPFARTPALNVAAAAAAAGASWQAAVVANGGTVSAGRLTIVNNFIAAEMAAGTWQLTDDYWGLWAENAPQALTSLKQKRLATVSGAPALTPDRGYMFGSPNYLNTNFLPATHVVSASPTNLRIAVYERTDNASTGYAMGCYIGTNNSLTLNPRTATSTMQGQINCGNIVVAGIADSRGFMALYRNAMEWGFYKNGAPLGTVVPGSNSSTSPTNALAIGCRLNTSSVAENFRPVSIGLACVGAALTAPQEVAQYNNVQAWAAAVGAASDPDAVTWAAQVVTNGGTVSAARLDIVSSFIANEKINGTWALTDDYWGLWAENSAQALTSLKQRRLSTLVNAPVFTPDRDYQFNGTTNYLNTGFACSTHAVAMTGTNVRIASYERTNVTGNFTSIGAHDSATSNLSLRPRSGTGLTHFPNGNLISYTLAVANSQGYVSASRNGATAAQCAAYQRGVALVQGASTTFGAVLPASPIFIGCYNNLGAPTNFRGCFVGFACVGAALSAAQELAQYNNVQAWATAVGAQV